MKGQFERLHSFKYKIFLHLVLYKATKSSTMFLKILHSRITCRWILMAWIMWHVFPSCCLFDLVDSHGFCNTCQVLCVCPTRWNAIHTWPRRSWSATATLRASQWRLTAPWAPPTDPGQSAWQSQLCQNNMGSCYKVGHTCLNASSVFANLIMSVTSLWLV